MNQSVRRLADIADTFNGKTPSKAEQKTEGFPVLKIKDVSEWGRFRGRFESFVETSLAEKHSARWVRKGDTLILNAAHNADYVGSKMFLADDDVAGCLPTGEWLLVRPNQSEVVPEYLYYWLRTESARSMIRFIVKGIHLYPKDVAELEVPWVPLSEQRRIVDLLSRAEGIVRLRREAEQKTAKLIPALFIDMFGDPVTNPKGWGKTRLGDLCQRITDGTHQPPKFQESGIPFIFVANIVRGELSLDTAKFISEETYTELTRRCPIEQGDVLYSTVGSYGAAVKVDTDERFSFQRHIAHLKPGRDKLDSDFLVGMLMTPALKSQADMAARGIAQKTINLGEIRKFEVIVPPIEEQRRFASSVEAVKSIQSQQSAASAKVKAMYDALLAQTFAVEQA